MLDPRNGSRPLRDICKMLCRRHFLCSGIDLVCPLFDHFEIGASLALGPRLFLRPTAALGVDRS